MLNREPAMISFEDCVALCGLDEDQVASIGEHEHLPDIAAAALGAYLLSKPGGAGKIREMMVDDIREALDQGRIEHAGELFAALKHFGQHPDAGAGLKAG